MKNSIISVFVALVIASPTIAQEAKTDMLYAEAEEDRFRAEVEYSRQDDGREFCSAVLLNRQSETALSLIAPGDRQAPAFILLNVPKGLLGFGDRPEAQDLRFEFVEQNGEKTMNSALGYWDFRIEEKQQGERTISHMMPLNINDLWGFARDWYDASAVFVTNENGEEIASLTLYRSQETMKALADCWSGTEGE